MTTKNDVIDYLSTKEEITPEQYEALTTDMSNKDVEANFKIVTKSEFSSIDSTSYERKVYYKINKPSDDDINSLLLYKLCKKQDETNT